MKALKVYQSFLHRHFLLFHFFMCHPLSSTTLLFCNGNDTCVDMSPKINWCGPCVCFEDGIKTQRVNAVKEFTTTTKCISLNSDSLLKKHVVMQ